MGKSVKTQKLRKLKVDTTTGLDKIGTFATQLDIDVPGLDDTKYEVGWKDWKDYQDDLPDYFQDTKNTITWFNNFYVKIPGETVENGRFKLKKYNVTLQAPPAGSALCYFDPVEKVAKPITAVPINGKVTFTLDLVDPPTGVYP